MRDNLKISKLNFEIIIIFSVLIFSFLNETTLFISMALGLLLLFQKEIGIIKLMVLLIMRTLISPGLLFDINNIQLFQMYKWVIIFGGSLILLISALNKKLVFDKILFILFILFVYLIISSVAFGSNNQLAIFKIINYLFPLITFYISKDLILSSKIGPWVSKVLFYSIILSIPLIFNHLGYLRNGHGFQGIYNNPNMFGIISVLTTAIYLYYKKNSLIKMLVIPLILLLILLSESRTSLFSFLIIIMIYLISNSKSNKTKLINFSAFIMGTSIIALVFNEKLLKFIQKGQDENQIFASRSGQIEKFNYAFNQSPLFGNGFGIPVSLNKTILNDNTVVEAGNLILAIIMFSGIFGLLVFFFLLVIWIKSCDFKKIVIILSTLLVSMGEMVLFSSNSVGLWCSLFWVLSLKNDSKDERHENNIPHKINVSK